LEYRVKIGLVIGDFAWEGGPSRMADTLAGIARAADDTGFSLIGVGDHLWQGPHAGGPDAPQLECFTTLALLAAHTSNVRLASIVAGVHFREPAVLVKAATTLDVLSGGRAVLGLGVGWDADEALGMGIAFPALAERFTMLKETLEVAHRLWSDSEEPYSGRHYQLERPLNVPQSLTRPRPPILLGGGGRKTLRLVAKYADACNLYPGPDLADKLAELRANCDTEGRDYDAIEKTVIFPFDPGRDGAQSGEIVETLRQLAPAGIDTALGIVSGPDPVRQVELIGKNVIPAVADV